MKKRSICALLAAVMAICTLFTGCASGDENVSSSNNSALEEYADVIVGDVKSFDDHGPLDEIETLNFEVPSSISEEDYYLLMGMYVGEDYVWYYELDQEKLYEEGIASYDIAHHSDHTTAKLTKEQLYKLWCQKAAVNIVTRDDASVDMNRKLKDLVSDTLNECGVSSDDYAGAVYRYIINHDSKGEMLSAAVDGDYDTLKTKYATLVADGMIEVCFNVKGASDMIDVVVATTGAEDLGQAGKTLCEEIEKKVFPEIDIAQRFATFVDKSFDIWAEDTINEAYEMYYLPLVKEDGYTSDAAWDAAYASVPGAWARYSSKGVSEAELREKFETRYNNSVKISEKEKELEKLVKIWDDYGLLNRYVNNYGSNWTVSDRLKSLYETRETIIEMFTKDGKLQMGSYQGKMTEEEFIEELVWKWTSLGVSKRSEFYKWIEDKGFVEKKEITKDSSYAWVKTSTKINQKDNQESDVYTTIYSAGDNTLSMHCEYHYRDEFEQADFVASCQVPEVIYPDVPFEVNETVSASGKTDLCFLANCWTSVGYDHLEDGNGNGTLTVGTYEGAEMSQMLTVYGTFSYGAEGSTMELKFCGCECDITYVYEWKEIN